MTLTLEHFENLVAQGWHIAKDERDIADENGVSWGYCKEIDAFAYNIPA